MFIKYTIQLQFISFTPSNHKMVYQSHLMSLSPDDIKKLGKGIIISLRQDRLGRGIPVFLNGLQAAQMKRGGNIRLRMSKHQFRHNVRHGGGLWDTFKEHALPHLVKFGTEQLKKHGPTLANKLLDKVQSHHNFQGKTAQNVLGFARKGLNSLMGKGMKHRHKRRHGGAPFGTMGASVTSRPVSKNARPIGGAPVGTMGASVTSRSVPKFARPTGGSFRLAGAGNARRRRGGSFMLA